MIRLENNENMYAVADTGSVINIIINGLTRISNIHTSFSIVETLTTSPTVVFPSNSLANFAWISDGKLVADIETIVKFIKTLELNQL